MSKNKNAGQTNGQQIDKAVTENTTETVTATENVSDTTETKTPAIPEGKKDNDVKGNASTPEPSAHMSEKQVEATKPPVKEDKVSIVSDTDIKIGARVKLKPEVSVTITGLVIPQFAYKNTYTVKKILPSRIIIAAGQYQLAVHKNDINIIK